MSQRSKAGSTQQAPLDERSESRWLIALVLFVATSTVLFERAWPIPSDFLRSFVAIGLSVGLFAILKEVLAGSILRAPERFLASCVRIAALLAIVSTPLTLLFDGITYAFSRKRIQGNDKSTPKTLRTVAPPHADHEELEPPIIDLGAGRLVVDASLSLTDLGRYLGVELPNPNSFSSLGRLLVATYGSVPPLGTKLSQFGFDFVIHDVTGYAVTKVEIQRPFSLRDTYNPLSTRVPPPDSEP